MTNSRQTNSYSLPRIAIRRNKLLVIAAIAIATCFISPPANADTLYGVDGNVAIGNTSSFSAGVIVGGSTSSAQFGGQGTSSFSFNELGSQGEAIIGGFSGTQIDSPLLRLRSDGPSSTEASNAFIGAISAFQYDGATAATISYDWDLTATLVAPGDTYAFVRGRAALLTNTEFYSTGLSNFLESSTLIEDSMNYRESVEGGSSAINESGTLSFVANPGDQFHLLTSLQTWAGETGSIANAYNTFSGNLTSSTGTLTNINASAVPEPGSACVLALAAFSGLLARRRR